MIVGLCGKSGAGKDTVADILCEDYGFVKVAFADSLKDVVYSTNFLLPSGIRVQDLVDEMGWDEAKRREPEVRRLLQETGQAVKGQLGESTWVDIVDRKITDAGTSNVVISDIRFEAEVGLVMDWDGIVIKVERSENSFVVRDHVSERLDVETKHIINNTGTSIEELRCEVAKVINQPNDSGIRWAGRQKRYIVNNKLLCNSCSLWKPTDEFSDDSKTVTKKSGSCRPCVNKRSKNKPSRSPSRRREEYLKLDKERLRVAGRVKRIESYGITEDEYAALLEAQGGTCAICCNLETRTHHMTGRPYELTIDHDHETGRVRGLLCSKCNRAIGALGDSHESIMRVVDYLKPWSV